MNDGAEQEGEITPEMYEEYMAKLKERLARPESEQELCADGKVRWKKDRKPWQVRRTLD
jgi:hypothetical protein